MCKRRMLLAVLLCACNPGRDQRERPAQAPDAAPVARAPEPATRPPAAGSKASCVDRELGVRSLNPYGDPPDTVYAGGTPLFDEKTGVATDRIDYVLAHRPEIAKACAAAK